MLVKAFRVLTVLTVASLSLLGVQVANAAAVSYVAMGDSYSSGVGTDNYGDSGDCRRSPESYAQLWADSHGADFNFVACSGAVTDDVLVQADSLTADTTHATLSVGGNDAGFVDVMIACTTSSDEGCADRVDEAKTFVNGELPAKLDAVYSKIKTNAPNAQVVVMGYPHFYKIGGSCDAGLSDTKRAAINSGADALDEVIADRAAAAGFSFADVRGPFTDHEICSEDWWLNSLTWPVVESYHPNAAGYANGYLPALEAVTG